MNYISILFVLFMFLYACTDENIINDASGCGAQICAPLF